MRFVFVFLFYATQSYAVSDEFSVYMNIASSNKNGMNSRWNALIKAAQFASETQLNQIQKFSESKEWYMRNASLIALSKVNLGMAMVEAKKLMQDKALVVRSAAVEILAMNLNEENKSILAVELNKPYNFNKNSSLWIRRQIIEKFSLSAGSPDRKFFVKSLFDSDNEIAQLSAVALAKITGQQVEGKKLVEKWQSIVKQNNWL